MREPVGCTRGDADEQDLGIPALAHRRTQRLAGGDVLPYVYRITASGSGRRPVEDAFLQAVAVFAHAAGADHVEIREPQMGGFDRLGAEPPVDGYGLAGLFPPDLAGFHDGAQVPVDVALELLRAMLRETGVWCRLEAEGVFAVHVGRDGRVYVGTHRDSEAASARARELGLSVERVEASPYDLAPDPSQVQRPADDDFWAYVRWLAGRSVVLEETYLGGATRWHRITYDNIGTVRARLAPRARLALWSDLLTDVDAALAALPDEGLAEVVREDEDGRIASTVADGTQREAVAAWMAGARAAAVVPVDIEQRHPLFTAVLPDSDGVLRARWRTEPTPRDRGWVVLKTLRLGQIVTGTVVVIASFGVTFVDIGGFTAMINIPELSWRSVEHPSDVVSVGQEITTEILDIDMFRERVSMSLRALQEDPWPQLATRMGQVVTGPVTRIESFGVFVRVEDRADGFVGLVPTAELEALDPGCSGDAVQVGDRLTVRIVEVDRVHRRITLSQTKAH
jgi:small subunit ribosomal protein S1